MVLAIGGAVALYLLLAWLLGISPHLSVSGPGQPTLPLADQQKLLADLVKVALGLAAGIGAAFALVVSFRRARAEEAASHRDDRRLFSSRYQDAADLIGSDKAAVRLAGIYAMARLADDWTEQQQQCIDVLCAYLRLPYSPDPETGDPGECQVRQSVIAVINSHLQIVDGPSWIGRNFDFSGTLFDGGTFDGAAFVGGTVSFRHAEFTGRVDFVGARFAGAVDFRDTTFGGEVSFRSARLSDVDFARARFATGIVNYRDAEFMGGTVGFFGAEFAGAAVVFHDAKFTRGKVVFSDAKFTRGSVDYTYTDFIGGIVEFDHAEFSGGAVDFARANFSAGTVSYRNAKFTSDSVGFRNARFVGGTIDFTGAEFAGGFVGFRNAKFIGGTVDFSEAQFTDGTVSFNGAEFTGGVVDLTNTFPGPGSATRVRFVPALWSSYSPRLPVWMVSQL